MSEPNKWEGETFSNERGDTYRWVTPEEAMAVIPALALAQADPAPFLTVTAADMIGLLRFDEGTLRFAGVIQGAGDADLIWWLSAAGAESNTPALRRWLQTKGIQRMRAVFRRDMPVARLAKLKGQLGYRLIGPGGPESDTYECDIR